MNVHPLQDFIRRLRRARSVTAEGHLSDAELLRRFAVQHDEAAFEVLVWRHGTLVLNVARRLLREAADTEDVFQATFLTLASKASAIRRGTALGSWLYKVAYRLALRVRRTDASRRGHTNPDSLVAPVVQDTSEETLVLAEEVNRLPERYRAVVVLCYLQGATTAEAARQLGCPRGTVLSRLASARKRLRQRLLRRGLAPTAALAATSFGATTSASPSADLVAGVVRVASPVAAGEATVSFLSPRVATLLQGALRTMLWNKIKIVAFMVSLLALTGSGIGWLTRGQAGGDRVPPAAELAAKEAPRFAPHRREKVEEEIDKIRKQLDELTVQENESERNWGEQVIDARLKLWERQEEFRRREESLREEAQTAIPKLLKEIGDQDRIIADYKAKAAGVPFPGLRAAMERKQALGQSLIGRRDRQKQAFQRIRDLRLEVFRAEERLKSIEARRVRQSQRFSRQRELLQTRLQQLQAQALDRDSADRLRDVERKLDSLRREVGELRRSLERPKRR